MPADKLRTLLGIRRVDVVADRVSLSDAPLLSAARAGSAASTVSSAPALSAASAASATITVANYSFQPGELRVSKGATVIWVNRDDDVHTIKSMSGPEGFASPALDSGGRFGFTFRQAGAHRYICSVHPYMHGVIVVQ